ncbi:MAG: hypothetical protein M3Z85_15500, partial [Acidobacteriota bacterium]|nr:hypothetical protein [Acidobacteriota bacterium]
MKTSTLLLLLALSAACATAGQLAVSLTGQFATSDIPGPLVAPGGNWALSFTVNSTPTVSNVDTLGFDVPYSNFSYRLNNSVVSAAPNSIRLYTTGGLGLFSLFFGPESGSVNGTPVPIFDFSGPQVFSGTTAAPTILAGSYAVSDWTYSDAQNYDRHSPAAIQATINAVP